MTQLNACISRDSRRKIRHELMNQILDNLKLPHTDENKDAILIPLERFFEGC